MIKVMIVDDESHVREIIKKLIPWEMLGLHLIDSCPSALAALESMRRDIPDILITDVKMPVMGGIELIHRAKELRPNMQCVILSGYDEFRLAQAAMAESVKYYLLKPCSRDELIEVIQKCIQAIKKDGTEMGVRENELKDLDEGQYPIEEIICRYVNTHYADQNLTLQFLANEVVHMNVQHVGKRFIQNVGMRFSEYLLKVRMNRAEEYLIRHKNCKIYEVAEAVGLGNNVQYFYHLFKQHTGMTPREYQTIVRNKYI